LWARPEGGSSLCLTCFKMSGSLDSKTCTGGGVSGFTREWGRVPSLCGSGVSDVRGIAMCPARLRESGSVGSKILMGKERREAARSGGG
jgi:hypothetical protein